MQNPNTPLNRMKEKIFARWRAPDFPGGEPRMQLGNLAKDIGLFVLFPALCVLVANASTKDGGVKRKASLKPRLITAGLEPSQSRSQIISFTQPGGTKARRTGPARAPGTLVKVRILNAVEALGEAPVHARILEYGLGPEYYGGVLLGEAAPEPNFSRMNINFNFAKRRGDDVHAAPIAARALSLDGTIGLQAEKAENTFARSALATGAGVSGAAGNAMKSENGLQGILFQALLKGLSTEVSADLGPLKNRGSVLTLAPGTEFFAELKDFFPAGGK